jgi:hypothetical protein
MELIYGREPIGQQHEAVLVTSTFLLITAIAAAEQGKWIAVKPEEVCARGGNGKAVVLRSSD